MIAAVDVATVEAQDPGAIAPDGVCANRTSDGAVSATGSKFTNGPEAPADDIPCCPHAFPTITM